MVEPVKTEVKPEPVVDQAQLRLIEDLKLQKARVDNEYQSLKDKLEICEQKSKLVKAENCSLLVLQLQQAKRIEHLEACLQKQQLQFQSHLQDLTQKQQKQLAHYQSEAEESHKLAVSKLD